MGVTQLNSRQFVYASIISVVDHLELPTIADVEKIVLIVN